MKTLAHLSNEDLVKQLMACAADRRRSTKLMLLLLVEVEKREIYLEVAASSMWDFCRRFLLMSHGTAYRFVRVARLCFDYPFILDGIERGELHLTTLTQIAPFIDAQNVEELVKETAGKKRGDVELCLARRFGKPLVNVSYGPLMPWDAELQDLIDRARELMSHAVPSGDVLELTKLAYRTLIHEAEKKTRAKATKPRPAPTKATKGISRHATREMFERHGEQCCYVDPKTGARCPSRGFLQRDHIVLRAHGGGNESTNLRPLCARHNVFLAKRALGRAYVERRIRGRQKHKRKQPTTVASGSKSTGDAEEPP
jgi:5-methylcytosine-specific restriction endonuclease McrA